MKKMYKSLIAGTALSAVLAFSASAADVNFTHCADALNKMGLFNGTGSGYALEKAPTRGEAAAMLVRLLGKETEALEKNYKSPFTDVPSWAAPYVGWLYENGLTNGTSETTYSANSNCTAQMYTTFLMRTLGYSDTGSNADFTYNNAVDFATKKGVVDMANYNPDSFLRDNVVAMSYTALATPPKSGEHDNLLDKLVADGAIDANKAKPVQDMFDVYDEYSKLAEQFAKNTSVDMDMDMNMKASVAGVSVLDMTMDMNAKQELNLESMDKTKMAIEGTTTMTINGDLLEGQDGTAGKDETIKSDMKAYYTDGVYYINTDGQKLKMPLSFDEALSSMGMDISSIMQTTREPISLIKSMTKAADGTYNVSYSNGFINSMIMDILGDYSDTSISHVSMSIDKLDMAVKAENGQIKSMDMDMAFSIGESVMNPEVKIEAGVDCDILGIGDKVKVTLPTDLNTYVDISEMPVE